MSKRLRLIQTFFLCAFLVSSFSGCLKKDNKEETNVGGGGTFTGSDLNGTFNSQCISSSGRISGELYFKDTLTIAGGNSFTYRRYSFTSSLCNYGSVGLAAWTSSGTFSVGGLVSGSLQSVTFTITSFNVQPSNGGTAWFNDTNNVNGCGSFTVGVTRDLYSNTCVINSLYTPNPANSIAQNVMSFSSGTISIGTPTEGAPGVFVTQGQALPTSTSISLQ
ncbi:MAG: hypothetical protein EOP04_16145 [Proteobacteria bacterium]|nr:MAG: hypothetical protein EOP04_16145 [Pseudomonadota bacterium]